jgi:hypothetical protein
VSKAEGVPQPTQILDNYLQALGGADKVSAITTISATGKSVAFGNFGGGGNFEYFAQAPDKRAMLSHLPTERAAGPSMVGPAGSRFRSRLCRSIHWLEANSMAHGWMHSYRSRRRLRTH